MPPYLRHFHGDLARAGLRFRYSRLRALPAPPTRYLGNCRLCRVGEENGYHLLSCQYLSPRLSPSFATTRDTLYQDIMIQAGLQWSPSRTNIATAKSLMFSLRWPNQSLVLLRKVLVFFRSVINAYARYPAPWEGPLSASYYVRPIRPPPLHEWEVPQPPNPSDELV